MTNRYFPIKVEAKKNHPFLVNDKRMNQATINPQISPVKAFPRSRDQEFL